MKLNQCTKKFEFLTSYQSFQEKTWCVAKASSDETSLQDNLHYACTQVDCSVINAGGSCFEPNLLISHASVAMNLYYQSRGRNVWNCDFTHSGLITISDPSKLLLITEILP
ncbi:hypothetical protein QJS04_geneDACA022226 [Acorus gramineus]|uniref:X8 domain-containing protein n=1 Tax=Acorus gramineus TaxID=55184 RepID=A0AAV9BKD2_ACOGR|nr:hypothetical protein QJS04_geneDACA022226 [Acorus gramineus]